MHTVASALGRKRTLLNLGHPNFGVRHFGMSILIFAASLLAFSSPVHGEECRLLLSKSESVPIQLALDNPTRLNALPDDAEAVACPRPSLVPMPSDVRVLSEWGVAFGIIEDGPRSLWIWAAEGRLQIKVDDGELSSAEAAAVRDWLERSQTQFDAALASR